MNEHEVTVAQFSRMVQMLGEGDRAEVLGHCGRGHFMMALRRLMEIDPLPGVSPPIEYYAREPLSAQDDYVYYTRDEMLQDAEDDAKPVTTFQVAAIGLAAGVAWVVLWFAYNLIFGV